METNYELKHKCLLVPLKAVLLVLAMVLVGFTTYAQQGKAVKVANNQQLIEAMENPSIDAIEFEAGYYPALNLNAVSGTKLKKAPDHGNRADQCQYFIYDINLCVSDAEYTMFPANANPAYPAGSYLIGEAQAGTLDILNCDCCPDNPPNVGNWTFRASESSYFPGHYLYFSEATNQEYCDFLIDGPGVYILRYEWGAPWNTYVQSEYVYRAPHEVFLSAPPVCYEEGVGTETTVTVEMDTLDVFFYDIVYRLKNLNTLTEDTIYPVINVIDIAEGIGEFQLNVDNYGECGYYELFVDVYTWYDLDPLPGEEEDSCLFTTSITIDFSCEPTADAGPDINVCNDLCYTSLEASTGLFFDAPPYYAPTYAYSWLQLSGPGVLEFEDNLALVTAVCAEDPECAYGEYEVQFQVQNGECYDEDEMFLRFYELPTANAGPDQHICNTFAFSLAAVPYEYCGEDGVNYWKHAWWELVEQPGNCDVVFDEFDFETTVSVEGCDDDCAFGQYVFVWHELNVKIDTRTGDTLWAELNCYASDEVIVTIYEDPAPDAGEDMVFCNTFAFSLHGIGDAPCYTMTEVRYSWEKTAEPGDCLIQLSDANILNPIVTISECGESCPYGEYIFTLTQCNGYLDIDENFVEVCCSTDDVSVWIFEEVNANAGADQHLCETFEFAFSSIPTLFCGEEGVNYFTWGEWSFVSGPTDGVTFDDVNDPLSGVSISTRDVECPYGAYTFRWTEYNGLGEGDDFEGCMGYDDVVIYIYETPYLVDAGDDLAFCETDINGQGLFIFGLEGALDEQCYEDGAYSYHWGVVSQPGVCEITFTPNTLTPTVYIDNCAPCQYGKYVFSLYQANGYYNDAGEFIMVCEWTNEVEVWIYQQPTDVFAGDDLLLCNTFAFDLTAEGADLCGAYSVNFNNWYSWTLVTSPADCDVTITNGETLEASVVIDNCTELPDVCAYGEYIFRFTEYNGTEDVNCYAWDEVSVFIFEMPVADAGDDVNECVDIAFSTYCYTMTGTLDYCYSMYGVWTKSCAPGDVVFTDVNDPASEVCFNEPGRYVFTWTAWNAAEDCLAEDEVIFDLLEQPNAIGEDDELNAPCDELCYSLYDAGIVKYEYYGTERGDCPNFIDMAHWSYVDGPTGDPAEVTFADDTDPATELCVSTFGCYTVRWNEVNVSVDGETECYSFYDVFVVFVETPEPDAGEDASVCDACYTMTAVPYIAQNCTEAQSASYWEWIGYEAPVDPCLTDDFAIEYSPLLERFDASDPAANICVVDDCLGTHYGTYEFRWVNSSGFCIGYDTVKIEFKKVPEELALTGEFNPSNCYNNECDNCEVECLYPNEQVMEVCAGSCLSFDIDWSCFCNEGPIPGYTYEWSFIGPSGSYMSAMPYYYDCDAECWVGDDNVYICFGECCDTARLYLTITSPQQCTTTEEWKFYVNHKPCANIEGPAISEVGAITTYCNVCPENYDMDCLLYTWTAEHCGEIVAGQGTECIDVLWTNYNVNGGWGEITLAVFDTCTGCCNFDYMDVKIHPAGTLGDATLSGHVYYHNNGMTPLNGVEIQLWNGGVPVMTTTSFNDVEGGGVGYYEFEGISGDTEFGITTSYDAPWYGANATDALAVELKTINSLPITFVYDDVVAEAMDVNNNAAITATDALWIKQRAINMVNYFPAGNWSFEPGMSSMAGTYDIYTLNAGDANRSNIPNSMKSAPAIALVNDGTMNVVNGQVFELPIRVAKADQFGAMTLNLEYNSALLEVVEVVPVEGMLSNVTTGNVSIAWSNTSSMVLAENDVVVTLKVKALGQISATESMFSIGMGSEFADPTANVIEPVTLKTFGITTDPAATDYFLSTNRPNPFSTSTFIEYTMPESGKVKLSVLDMLGQEIAVLVEATQTAGSYTVEFSAAGLATGVYMYKITVDGETRDFISTQRMVISH